MKRKCKKNIGGYITAGTAIIGSILNAINQNKQNEILQEQMEQTRLNNIKEANEQGSIDLLNNLNTALSSSNNYKDLYYNKFNTIKACGGKRKLTGGEISSIGSGISNIITNASNLFNNNKNIDIESIKVPSFAMNIKNGLVGNTYNDRISQAKCGMKKRIKH